MNSWRKEKHQDVLFKSILFLISPFLAFIYSLRRINTRSSYLVFFLFSVFFGMVFTVESGRGVDGVGYDGQIYRLKFELLNHQTTREFIKGLKDFFSFNDGQKDYYFDTVAFLISRGTDNYHVMFMVFAMVFAYFSLKSFRYLTQEEKFDASLSSYVLAYLFMSNQIFNINGVRFWTAAWISIYCIFKIYKDGKSRYFILALTTPFFHGSYWIFIAVLLIAFYFKRLERIWVVLFFISFFIASVSVDLLQYAQAYLPDFLAKSIEIYTDQEYIDLRNSWSGFGWIPYFSSKIKVAYLSVLVFLLYRHSKEIKNNKKTKDLYLFMLVWVSIFNFLMFVPSLGARYITLAYPILAYIWLVNFKDKRYQWVLFSYLLFHAWDIFITLFRYGKVTSIDFYISNPLYLFYKYILA